MFLNPIVYIVKNEYHIVIIVEDNSQVFVKIGNKYYYEDNSGILPTLDKVHKIKIKQSILDKYGSYQVIVKKVIDKTTYFPKYEDARYYNYVFKNDKFDDIVACYLADVHNKYLEAIKVVNNCGNIDLFICNGDLGECSSEDEIMQLCSFLSDISKGVIPILFVRGNHDTRGKCAEVLPKYVGMNGLKGYFPFTFRSLSGIALDCGEDKVDNHLEYGGNNDDILGANRFELYRKEELAFIKKTNNFCNKYNFAVCHTSFMLKESMHDIFDIDENNYSSWIAEINKKNLDFMICGHIHKFLFNNPGDDRYYHNFPVVTGSSTENCFGGTKILFSNGSTSFEFIYSNGTTLPKHKVYCKK